MGDVDTEQLLVSKKISFREKNYKYFIGYLYNGNPLNIMLPKTSLHVKQNIDWQNNVFFDWRWWLISCLGVISLDFALKKDDNYYVLKRVQIHWKKVVRHIQW